MGHADYVEGYGCRGANGVDIRTVSDTRRAAIVNWLVVHGKYFVTNNATDEAIESVWEHARGDWHVVPVRVYAQ